MFFVLFYHLEFFLVRSHYLFKSILEQRLSIYGFWFVILLILQSLSISLIIHVVFFQSIELFQVLISLNLIFRLDLDYFLFQLLSSFLFLLYQKQLVL